MVWDHAGTGTVRSRDIHQQIGRAEKRLGKLNQVEADRLAHAGVRLAKAIRSCKGVEGVGDATMVAEEGARVGKQLAEASADGQVRAGATIARRGKRSATDQILPARQTRGSAARAGATLASVVAAREAVEEEDAAEDQALQESGLEGRPVLVERGVEVQEGGRVLLVALSNREPGHLEKVRTRMGQWGNSGR